MKSLPYTKIEWQKVHEDVIGERVQAFVLSSSAVTFTPARPESMIRTGIQPALQSMQVIKEAISPFLATIPKLASALSSLT